MRAYLLPDGRLLAPARAESEDGRGPLGDGMRALPAESEEAKAWLAYYRARGESPPRADLHGRPLPEEDRP